MKSAISLIHARQISNLAEPLRDIVLACIIGPLVSALSLGSTLVGQTASPSINEVTPTVARELALKMISAVSDDARDQLIQLAAPEERPLLVKELLNEARRSSTESMSDAERIARIGVFVAQQIRDEQQTANAWLAVSGFQTDEKAKFDSLSSGLEAAKKSSDNELVVRIITNMGPLEETREKQIERYLSGLPFAERSSDRSVLSALLGRIGNAYTQNGDFSLARQFHSRSLEIKRQMNDQLGIATTISNLGVISGMLGDTAAALESFEKSLAILDALSGSQTPNLSQRKAKDLRNLGIVYQAMGDSAQALLSYSRSLRVSEDAKYANGVFGALFQMAALYNEQGDFVTARQLLKRADNVSDENQISSELSGLLADSYVGEGRYQEALNARMRQLADVEKHEGKDDLASCLINVANIYLLMRRPVESGQHFRRALDIGRTIGSPVSVQRALLGLLRSALDFGDLTSAARLCKEIEAELKSSRRAGGWEVFSTIGSAYARLGDVKSAQAYFEKAIAEIERRRKGSSAKPESQQRLFSDSESPFNSMVSALMDADSVPDAFSASERAKAHILLEVLKSGQANISRSMSAAERVQEQNLRNEIAEILMKIDEEKESSPLGADVRPDLENRLAQKNLELDVFQSKVYLAHPELRSQRGEMRSISLEETASLIHDDKTALIEFVVGSNSTFLFVISRDAAGRASLLSRTISVKSAELAKNVEIFRSKLAAGDLDFQRLSHELYDLLLKPVQAELANKNDLIIVPDGPLWNLPFQALQTVNGKYLVEAAAVSYAPSLTALREMKNKAVTRRRDPRFELLAFGNPDLGKQTTDKVKTVFMDETLEPLPEAERLVNSLKRMYGDSRSLVYTGGDASEDTAKAEAGKFSIIQFATHGIINNTSPMYSHLVMARNADTGKEDGMLEAWELKDLDLNADLVILSACDTARGKIASGEGMIGMAWAAFIAGTPTTVASQWKVESSSTTELMLEFHRQLLTGKVSKSEALRRAELRLMKIPRYRHPSFWAGFVLVGNGS
jgi:CHAT domain-containing protein